MHVRAADAKIIVDPLFPMVYHRTYRDTPQSAFSFHEAGMLAGVNGEGTSHVLASWRFGEGTVDVNILRLTWSCKRHLDANIVKMEIHIHSEAQSGRI
jgi:hypothetical protein